GDFDSGADGIVFVVADPLSDAVRQCEECARDADLGPMGLERRALGREHGGHVLADDDRVDRRFRGNRLDGRETGLREPGLPGSKARWATTVGVSTDSSRPVRHSARSIAAIVASWTRT